MRAIILIILVALTGCVSPQPPHTLATPFADADFRPWAATGKATLSGQAVLRTVGGDAKTCAGADVYLMPGTKLNLERADALKKGEKVLGGNAEADKYLKKGKCDAQGHFNFKDLPALTWIVLADVIWNVPTEYTSGRQGGVLMKTVDLHPGPNEVILTGDDENP